MAPIDDIEWLVPPGNNANQPIRKNGKPYKNPFAGTRT